MESVIGERGLFYMCNLEFKADEIIEQVIDKYADMVYRLALAKTQNKYDAEDVFQTVFMKYLKKAPVFESEEHQKAWLIRVTVNCSKSIFLSYWRKNTQPLEKTLQTEDKEKIELFQELKKLPQRYREVIHLFYYEDLSVAQISEILHRKESTVRTQLTRARSILRSFMKEEDYV